MRLERKRTKTFRFELSRAFIHIQFTFFLRKTHLQFETVPLTDNRCLRQGFRNKFQILPVPKAVQVQDSLYNNNAGPRDLPRRQSVQYGNTVVMEVVVSSDIMLKL